MSYVVINVLSVPEGRGEVLEQRFAARAGAVDRARGFERFELLRPIEGTGDYLVYTRWRSRDDFEAWQSSQAFERGHGDGGAGRRPDGTGAAAGDGGRPAADERPVAGERPAATGSSIWAFEVAQDAVPA